MYLYHAMLCIAWTMLSQNVCLFVCLSHAGVVLKRLNVVSSNFFHRLIATPFYTVSQNTYQIWLFDGLTNTHPPIFSQPSICIDGWLYAMSMTSVVCNVPVLSPNDSTYHHSVFTTWKWHPFATWTPSFIILVWGHHPPLRRTVFACLQNSRYY